MRRLMRAASPAVGAGFFALVALAAGAPPALAAAEAQAVKGPAAADAQQRPGAREEAKAAFGRGNTAYNLGKYPEAIAAFEQAYALSRLPDILFNLGQCYRKQFEAEKRTDLAKRALHYYEALLREAPSSSVRPTAEQFIGELRPAIAAAEAQDRAAQIAAARGSEALTLAQSTFAAGQLQDAAGILDHLLKEPGNGREVLAEGYLLRGRVAAGLGDVLGAEAHFKRALELRPGAELADPRGQEQAALDAARKVVAPGGLRLVQAPIGEVPAQKPARLDVRVEGDTERLVDALQLSYRGGETGAFQTARAKPPTAPLDVPAPILSPGARIDYFVSALDEHGSVLAESGTATLPFRLRVAAPPALIAAGPPRWYQHWWLWTIVGAAAAGAGVATYVATRPEHILTVEAMPR